jgi:hypothetical protein
MLLNLNIRSLNWFFFTILVASYIFYPLMDPDLWWHVTVGKWIISNGTIPYKDYWNMYGAGKPWFAYSWSIEALFGLTYNFAGETGLLTLKFALLSVLAFTLCFVFGSIAKDFRFGLIIGTVTAIIFDSFSLLRPQTFVCVYLALLLYILNNFKVLGDSWPRRIALTLVMSLWANSHITTIFGIVLIAFWNLQIPLRKNNLKLVLTTLFFGFVGTLITPYGGYEWVIFFSKSDHPILFSGIIEFGPASIRDYSTGIMIILLTLFVVIVTLAKTLVPPAKIFLVLVFSVGAFGVVKFIPIAAIIISAVTAEIWNLGRKSSELQHLFNSLDIFFKGLQKIEGKGLVFLMICLIYLNISASFNQIVKKDIVPVKALNFAIENDLPEPIINTFGDGGYLMYRYSDPAGNLDNKVPIDGRTNVNPFEIHEMHVNAIDGRVKWKKFLNQVKPKTVIWRKGSSLTALLIENDNWCNIYCDGAEEKGMIIFLRKNLAKKFPSHKRACSIPYDC